VLKEMNAARAGDLKSFDAALFGHIRHVFSNETRAFLMAITGSRFVSVSSKASPRTRRYYRKLTRISAALAYAADVSMLVLGGSLKRRERISARLGDVLSMLYLASATLKRFEDEGRQEADLPLLDWSLQDSLFRAAEALHGVLANYPVRLVGSFLRLVTFPLGRHFAPPATRSGTKSRDCSSRHRRRATGSAQECTCRKRRANRSGASRPPSKLRSAPKRSRPRSARPRNPGRYAARTPRSSRRPRSRRASSVPKSRPCSSARRSCATR